MHEIENLTREQIAKFLPDAMERALGSYKEFISSAASVDESKNFKAQNDAGKVAIAHIRLLVELAKWADLPEESGAVSQDKLAELIQSAKGEVNAFEGKKE